MNSKRKNKTPSELGLKKFVKPPVPPLFAGIAAAVFIITAILAGCGGKNDPGAQAILVGTSNDYPPICYLDADGNLTGFEKAVLDAVDEKLPQYSFKYEVLEFKNILASLEAGRLDIAAHNYTITEERLEKYLFSEEGYLSSYVYIVVPGDVNDVTNFDDLRGKRVSVPPASDWAYAVESYNARHQDTPILIDYFEGTPDVLITNLLTGVVDATLLHESDVKLANTFWGTSFKIVGEPIGDMEEARYVFRKESGELRQAVDQALRELKASGELAAITKKAVDDFFANAAR
ncbi:MAG: transporter substrate-binding domain-containing protein [Treponema sp.]|jgi:L-cystine transport system substrate-binding protein|nr:transporter substrate-binding domain-containing protein [Treponema sp.]